MMVCSSGPSRRVDAYTTPIIPGAKFLFSAGDYAVADGAPAGAYRVKVSTHLDSTADRVSSPSGPRRPMS